MHDTLAFPSNANNAWIFNGNNGNVNNGNNRYNTNAARVFRDSCLELDEGGDGVVTLPELYRTYLKNRRNKRRSKAQLFFECFYPANLRRMWKTLTDFEYILRPCIAFTLKYPVDREVIAPDYFDRVPQYWFCETIREGVERRLDPGSYSCRVGRGPLAAARELARMVRRESRAGAEPCVFVKNDQRSYFLHIDRRTLVEDINRAIREDFAADPQKRDFLLYLCRILFLSDTIAHAIRRCPVTEWAPLPKHKSRYNLPAWIGLDIGNHDSQIGAAYKARRYLRAFRDYGFNSFIHYSDDVVSVLPAAKAEQFKRIFMPHLRQVESAEGLELNEKKFYLQDARKGVSAVGFFIKQMPDGAVLMLPSKRVIHNLRRRLRVWFARAEGDRLYRLRMKERFCSSVNSYFGIFRNSDAYNLRRRITREILASPWSDVIVAKPDYTGVAVAPSYTLRRYLTFKNRQLKHQILHYHDQRNETAD